MAKDCGSFTAGLMPLTAMVSVQIALAGVNILYKFAVNDGMNLKILVAYRHIFATAFLGPLAFFLERKTRPKLTWMVLLQTFFCGLFGGSLAQNMYIESLSLTSATYVAAMWNLMPAITFIVTVVLGVEKLKLNTVPGKAKILGTMIGIGGAMLLTFYRGSELNIWRTDLNLLNHHHEDGGRMTVASHSEAGNRVMGSLLTIACCFSYSAWLMIQTRMNQTYPCYYSSTALMCLMGAIQSSVFAIATEKDWTQWKIGWDIRLLTVVYGGFVASGLVVVVMSWCIQKRGPLYVSVFSPLMLIVVALVASFILDERLHLGSVLGSILIVIGLYFVLWAKGKELKKMLSSSLPTKMPATDSVDTIVSECPEYRSMHPSEQEKESHNNDVSSTPTSQKEKANMQ